jgi:hypothetical protein
MVIAASTTWYAARAGGMVAYLLLTAAVAVGLLLSGRVRLNHWPRLALEDVHRFLGILAGTFIVVHGGALLLEWRRAHRLNFAVWALALVHGLTVGTDTWTPWALVLYAGSAWLVLALLVHRVGLDRAQPARSS